MMTLDEAKEKIAQAYQILGFALRKGMSLYDWDKGDWASPQESEYIRVLDYFSDTERFDPGFLPWPKL